MKCKFFIGAAVGFVGGVTACWKYIEKHGYFAPDALKRRFARLVVERMYGPEFIIAHRCFSENRNEGYVDYARYAPEKPVENMKDKTFELVRIFGKDALLCTDRGVLMHAVYDTEMTPWFIYDLRGSDNDPEMPATVELFPVHVNYCGAIITKEELIFPKNGDGSDSYIELKSGDLQCCDAMVSAESFMKGNYDVWEDCWYDWNEDDEQYWDAQFEDENEEEGDDDE